MLNFWTIICFFLLTFKNTNLQLPDDYWGTTAVYSYLPLSQKTVLYQICFSILPLLHAAQNHWLPEHCNNSGYLFLYIKYLPRVSEHLMETLQDKTSLRRSSVLYVVDVHAAWRLCGTTFKKKLSLGFLYSSRKSYIQKESTKMEMSILERRRWLFLLYSL